MINERKLSKSELEDREDIIMKMKGNKRDLVKKYGKDAEAVMYGRATNMAKKKTENMRDPKITELIKDALKNPKKADLDKDGKLSDYEETRGKAIEKSMAKEDLESGQYGDPKVGNYDITSQNDNEASDIEALSAAGLEEGNFDELKKHQEMMSKAADFFRDKAEELDIDIDLIKNFNAGTNSLVQSVFDADNKRSGGKIDEDIDIGHEDNEPGMLQGDLYQIGKSAMEIYALLDDMEGEGEVDLPSWWQAKIFKAKEAIVGAAEYLDFELKEPAVDAVVDTIEPLEIEVDPLGETVEDYITGVDDFTENQKVAEKVFNKLKEGLPKGFWDKKIDAKDEDQDGKVDEVGGYDRKGNKEVEVEPSRFKGRDKSRLREDFDDVVDDIMDQGKSRKDAEKIAGAINAKYVGNYRQEEGLDESYETLVNKIKKSGKSEKAAKAIAGAVASYKAKGGGKGPTAKQK